MTLVVDASAVGAVLFHEPDGPTIEAHTDGETLIAPHLIDFELANICWKRLRREPGKGTAILAMLSGLKSVGIKRVEVPATEIAALAVQTGLTAYDASYLWLAISQDVELVTLDDKLARVNHAMRERFV